MDRGALRLFLGLYGSLFLIRFSFSMIVVLIAEAYEGEGLLLFGVVVALNPLAELLTVPAAGLANDRYGRKPIFVAGLALGAVSLLMRLVWRDLFGLAVLNLLAGAAAALILVTSLALLAEHSARETRGRQMGLFDFITILGILLGFVAGFLLADRWPGRSHYGFGVAGLIAAGAFLVAWLFMEEPSRRKPVGEARLRDLGHIVTKPRVALVIGPWLIIYIFVGGLSGQLKPLADELGFTGTQAASGIAVLMVAVLVSQIGYGYLSDRYGRAPLMLLGAGGFFALMTTLAVIALRAGDAEDALVLALRQYGGLLTIEFLAMMAFAPAALAALADEAEEGPTGLTMSLYSLALSLGFILGPILTGAASDVGRFLGVGRAAGVTVLWQVLGFGLAFLVYLRYRHALPRIPIPKIRT